jgi:hypothetical protein
MTQWASSERGESPPETEQDPTEAPEQDELEAERLEEEEEEEEAPRRRFTTEAVVPWALVAALVLIALALFWNAGEAHYRGCVEAVGVRTAGDNSPLGRFARQDVTKCTRSPF